MKVTKYVLGIHSNVTANAEFIDGHAWITITTLVGKGRFVTSYGLWPDGHPKTIDNGDKTDVRVGMEPESGIANRYYALTMIQHELLVGYIKRTEHWFYTNNCSSWAGEIVRKLFGTEIDADDWFGIETPRELAHSITILEFKEPTSITSPKILASRIIRRGNRRYHP